MIDESTLRNALTIRNRRRVSNDSVLSFDGTSWELDQSYLAGQTVTVAHCFATPGEPPWVEHEGKRYPLRPLDAVKNSARKRAQRPDAHEDKPTRFVEFDPVMALWKPKTRCDILRR
ncbi:MAG: hypothetical protein IPM54_21165 [Polyangiaceae bacterium]|nr:hypothetical protein [Polyangiaceae bacterium]